MHQILFAAAIAALAAGSADAADTKAASEASAAWTINETSWEFTVDGRPMQESIDASGNYVITSGAEHIDHGTAVMKDGKICSTSAMTSDGEICWTAPPLEVGASAEAVSDRGQKLVVKRVAYVPPAM